MKKNFADLSFIQNKRNMVVIAGLKFHDNSLGVIDDKDWENEEAKEDLGLKLMITLNVQFQYHMLK